MSTAWALIVVIAIIIIAVFAHLWCIYYPYSYVTDWWRIAGAWEVYPDPISEGDAHNRLPPRPGIVIRVDEQRRGKIGDMFKVWISFCDFERRGFRRVVVNESTPMLGVAHISNTGINIIVRLDGTKLIDSSRMYNFEFLSITGGQMRGYIAGPDFDSIVVLRRVHGQT
jgi:hypothetical protein